MATDWHTSYVFITDLQQRRFSSADHPRFARTLIVYRLRYQDAVDAVVRDPDVERQPLWLLSDQQQHGLKGLRTPPTDNRCLSGMEQHLGYGLLRQPDGIDRLLHQHTMWVCQQAQAHGHSPARPATAVQARGVPQQRPRPMRRQLALRDSAVSTSLPSSTPACATCSCADACT